MKTLLLITSNYPFGSSEPFPATELPFLQNEFGKIIIIAQNSSSEQTHSLPEEIKIYRHNTSTSPSGFLTLPFLIIKNFNLISDLLREETDFRKVSGSGLTTAQKKFLFRKIIKAVQLRIKIGSVLKSENISSEIVFYSYWLNSGAHAIGLLDYPRSIKIARAHGSDLYEEKTERGYLPLLRSVSQRLDALFFISENGKNYFAQKTGDGKAELIVSRLGVISPVTSFNELPEEKVFKIVSCSNLVPLKRIDLIIKALALIKDKREIHWIHFGSGILRKDLESTASEILGKKENIKFEFRGFVNNEEIFKYYTNNRINLFLNTSITEGVPVSIMEAQCFGIPVIATDVGGVSELVNGETGFLLPSGFRTEELAEKISILMNMNSADGNKMRERAFASWDQKFNAARNYPEFIKNVNRIFETSKREIR